MNRKEEENLLMQKNGGFSAWRKKGKQNAQGFRLFDGEAVKKICSANNRSEGESCELFSTDLRHLCPKKRGWKHPRLFWKTMFDKTKGEEKTSLSLSLSLSLVRWLSLSLSLSLSPHMGHKDQAFTQGCVCV